MKNFAEKAYLIMRLLLIATMIFLSCGSAAFASERTLIGPGWSRL